MNLYGPARQLRPASSHVIPALIRSAWTRRIARAPAIEVWGDGLADARVPLRGGRGRGIVLAAERYDGPEPVNLGARLRDQDQATWSS